MSDLQRDYAQREYARALAAYRKVLDRLKRAKAALVKAKAKPQPRTYTLAEIDAMFPPSPHIARTIKWPSTPPHDE